MLQVLQETAADYTAFINEITERVTNLMGEGYTVRIYKVTKNNSLELDSLVILKKEDNYSPNIYLLPYYEDYIQGSEINELAERICMIYQNNKAPVVDERFSYSFDHMKSYVIYRLVSYDKNRKLLEQIPHIRFIDMAVTFHCLVRDDDDGIGTIRITNEHMKMWGTSLQELQKLALSNTADLFPPVIRSMDEVIMGMLRENYDSSGNDEITGTILDDLKTVPEGTKEHKMYILSNNKGINGATCLLYDNVLHEFADQIHSDFFILPSSIHEVILVPYDRTISKRALSDMVKDVNLTQVARDEVLSDHVYFYSRKNNSITM